jgi:hypothetical protein
MYTKVSRHITSRIYTRVFLRRGHESTWFSNIIYSAPPEPSSAVSKKKAATGMARPFSSVLRQPFFAIFVWILRPTTSTTTSLVPLPDHLLHSYTNLHPPNISTNIPTKNLHFYHPPHTLNSAVGSIWHALSYMWERLRIWPSKHGRSHLLGTYGSARNTIPTSSSESNNTQTGKFRTYHLPPSHAHYHLIGICGALTLLARGCMKLVLTKEFDAYGYQGEGAHIRIHLAFEVD